MSGREPGITETSHSLLARVKARDEQGWERLVRLYAPLVAHWCRRWRLQPADLADVVQEVFRSVAGHVGRFETGAPGGTFRGWLRTITWSRVQDHFRARARAPQPIGGSTGRRRIERIPDGGPPAGEDPEPLAEDPEAEAAAKSAVLARALEAIRPEFEDRTWAAFRRTAVDGRAAADVAGELGLSPGAVRVAKCRILRRLREELGDLPG